jgi:hypothetical protein
VMIATSIGLMISPDSSAGLGDEGADGSALVSDAGGMLDEEELAGSTSRIHSMGSVR